MRLLTLISILVLLVACQQDETHVAEEQESKRVAEIQKKSIWDEEHCRHPSSNCGGSSEDVLLIEPGMRAVTLDLPLELFESGPPSKEDRLTVSSGEAVVTTCARIISTDKGETDTIIKLTLEMTPKEAIKAVIVREKKYDLSIQRCF